MLIPAVVRHLPLPQPGEKVADLLLHTPAVLVAAAIDGLESRERVILSLVYFEELEYEAIARVLKINLSDVFQIRDRAINQVEAALKAS